VDALRGQQRRGWLYAVTGVTAEVAITGGWTDNAGGTAATAALAAVSKAIDSLAGPQLQRVANGEKPFSWWATNATGLYEDIKYLSGLWESWSMASVLSSTAVQTAEDVGELGGKVVDAAPFAAAGLLVTIALVAAAYLVFKVGR
jgi:hypothetical protein